MKTTKRRFRIFNTTNETKNYLHLCQQEERKKRLNYEEEVEEEKNIEKTA